MSSGLNMDRLRLEALERRKIEAGSLIQSRKRKLAELYSVSTLSRIREINDEVSLRPVKDSLMSFLEKNDLQNGHIFDSKTLQSSNASTQQTPSQSQNQPQELQPAPNPTPQQPNQQDAETESQLQRSSQQSQAQPISNKPPPKEAATSDNEVRVQPNITDSTSDANEPSEVPVEKVESKETRIDEEQNKQPEQEIQKLPRRPIVKKRKTSDNKISLFDPFNKEAIDTHVLLLKEQLPPRIAEATPLAELYYLAQTLPLVKLMPSTHKVITSTMFETALTEGKINVVHSRIEELKRQGKWSLRQPTKFIDPIRGNTKTHWNHLLSEMNWMATDFREERKLKIATCAYIAQSISDYWNYGKVCCVKRKPIEYLDKIDEDKEMEQMFDIENAADDDVDEKDNIDISKILARPDLSVEITPPELPQVSEEEYAEHSTSSAFKASIDFDSLTDQNRTLLEEMPAFTSFEQYDDKFSSAPLVPVSKSLIPIEDDTWYNVLFKQIVDESDSVPAHQKGLFGFSSQKRINTSIKPPPPPSLKYLDLRTPTIWLPEDDQNLIEYVNQFSFNWGVVSAYLSKKPTRSYSSNIERRTPWQCFERYIQLNDTFQINDMRGQNTLSAMKWLEHAHNIQATTKRRISPLGVGVDSIQRGHKRLRWASMFEAIRKCMRKRESVTRPNNNQVRKNGDDKKLGAPTPAELSKLKFERDKAIQEAYMQNPANGFRGRMPQAAPGPSSTGNHSTGPNGPTPPGSNVAPAPRSASQSQAQNQNQLQQQQLQQRFNDANKRPNSVPVPGQAPQSRAGMTPASGSATSNSVPTGQRVAQPNAMPKITGPNGVPYTPEQVQQLMQLRQRKLMQQAQQQAQAGTNGSQQGSPSPNIGNAQLVNPSLNQANLNANNIRSNSNPQVSGTSSPLIGQAQTVNPTPNGTNNNGGNGNNGRKLTFVPAHVSAIINQIQSQNPNMSKQEVTKIAAQYLANLQAKQNRVNSVNGNGNAGSNGSISSGPIQNAQNRVPSTQASPTGMSQAKLSSGVPTPQQILQQQAVTSSPTVQSPRVQQAQPQQPVRIQQQSPAVSSPQIPLQQSNSVGSQGSPALTPQQKAQLDMLKALHAEQQQKRQQQQQQQNQQGGQQFQQFQQQNSQPQQLSNSNIQNNTPNKSNAKSLQPK